ncbi:MAG TPA: ATP-binding protein [Polyangiaceae bacterium]|nr:ATP-binding protein [Polyangiaceae bacterium]
MSSTSKSSYSVRTLRNLILLALALGVAGYTATMFSYSRRLLDRFGPQVRADLEWRALRGAQELSRACDVGLVVGDPAMTKKAFGAYATSSDVQAIVALDSKWNLLAQHGTPPEPLERLFSGKEQELRAGPGYIVSWANSTIEEANVGRVAIVISTRRLTEANALLSRVSNVTLGGGVLMLVLGVVVISFFARAVAQRDAQLSEYASNLEQKVEERTREVEARTRQLDERNRGMRLVLDNVAQGFVTIDLAGRMASESSQILARWFGAPEPGMTLARYLEKHAPKFAEQFMFHLTQVEDGFLPTEVALDQLPKRFSAEGRTFDVVYTPVGSGEQLENLLVIINDVTTQLARERAEREQNELREIFQRILIDPSGVEEFLTEASKLITDLETETDPVVQHRIVHTLKGNSGVYGLNSLADLAHEVETQLMDPDHGPQLTAEQRTTLSEAWRDLIARVEQLLGGSRKDQLEIGRSELNALLARARSGIPQKELIRELESWTLEPVERRFERLRRQAFGLARRLGKAEPTVVIDSGGVRSSSPQWTSYWAAMVHVVRNAVDHGLEETSSRTAAGKPAAGRIVLGARRNNSQIQFWVEDDGRGIDWERVKVSAERLGLPHRTREELIEVLFADGLTTRDEVTDLSGRGVGLAALRQSVSALHGVVSVDSVKGRGTTFRFTFDESKLGRDAAATH